MKQLLSLLRESLPDAVGGLIAAAIIAVIGLLSGAFKIDTEVSSKIVILGSYLILCVGTVYVFTSQRKSIIDPSNKLAKFGWKRRLFSACALLVATGLVIWFFWPYNIPKLRIKLINTQSYDIAFTDEPEFALWLDVPLGDDRKITTGRLRLVCAECVIASAGEYVALPNSEIDAYVEITDAEQYRPLFEAGNVWMMLVIKNRYGNWVNEGASVDFTREVFENYYVPIELTP